MCVAKVLTTFAPFEAIRSFQPLCHDCKARRRTRLVLKMSLNWPFLLRLWFARRAYPVKVNDGKFRSQIAVAGSASPIFAKHHLVCWMAIHLMKIVDSSGN